MQILDIEGVRFTLKLTCDSVDRMAADPVMVGRYGKDADVSTITDEDSQIVVRLALDRRFIMAVGQAMLVDQSPEHVAAWNRAWNGETAEEITKAVTDEVTAFFPPIARIGIRRALSQIQTTMENLNLSGLSESNGGISPELSGSTQGSSVSAN